VVKPAFTLIELIFAIVVIAISVVSLPMMTQVTSKAIDSNLIQEAIFAASTELNSAVTAHWDENSLEDNESSLSRVIDDGKCENNSSLANYRQKKGHINQPLHRRCLQNSSTSISNAKTNDKIFALDDMEKNGDDLSADNSGSASGYKHEYTTTISVDNSNISFGKLVNSTNLKKLTVEIKVDSKVVTKLHTYSANIGEVDYYKRSMF
jgi:prepilin-type N-terminal cleavage/methylation domain-containing protein